MHRKGTQSDYSLKKITLITGGQAEVTMGTPVKRLTQGLGEGPWVLLLFSLVLNAREGSGWSRLGVVGKGAAA